MISLGNLLIHIIMSWLRLDSFLSIYLFCGNLNFYDKFRTPTKPLKFVKFPCSLYSPTEESRFIYHPSLSDLSHWWHTTSRNWFANHAIAAGWRTGATWLQIWTQQAGLHSLRSGTTAVCPCKNIAHVPTWVVAVVIARCAVQGKSQQSAWK